MKSIVIISVYFGKFPHHFDLLLESIKKNPTVDFLVITDQEMTSNLPNLSYINMSLEDLDTLIKKKLNSSFGINDVYKCCDYKPVYGVLFEDYVKHYDYWGHCDLDLLFGNIRKFITDSILEKYDKILPLGHLSIYRNTSKVNNRFKDVGSKCGDYDMVFSSEKSFFFDEQDGIGSIYNHNKYPFYDKRVFADISIMRKRFSLSSNDINYDYQVFYWEDGSVYRAYEKGGSIKKDEFVYIHFKQRSYLRSKVSQDPIRSFYICNSGFIDKELGLPALSDIRKYNPFKGNLYELLEFKSKLIYNKLKMRLSPRFR